MDYKKADIHHSLDMRGGGDITSHNYNGEKGFRIWTDLQGEGHMAYSAMGGIIYSSNLTAGHAVGAEVGTVFDTWSTKATTPAGSGGNTVSNKKLLTKYFHRDGITTVKLTGYRFIESSDNANGSFGRINLTAGNNTSSMQYASNGSFSLEVDVSGLTAAEVYNVSIDIDAHVGINYYDQQEAWALAALEDSITIQALT